VKKQLQTLTNKVRLLAVILYYTMLMLTLLSGIILKRPNITLGFTALEICAYLWYCFCWSTYSKTFVKHVQEHHQQHHHHHHYHHHHHQHSVNTQTNIQSQMP